MRSADVEIAKRAVKAGLLSVERYREAYALWKKERADGKTAGFGEFLETEGYLKPGMHRKLQVMRADVTTLADDGDDFLDSALSSSSGGDKSDASSPAAAMDSNVELARLAPAEGGRVGPYHLHEQIARGGMGVIFRATHETLGRACALKVLCPDGPPLPEDTERFRREAQAAGRLKHPNIVSVSDAGYADSYFFIAMDLIGGDSLANLLGRKLPGEQEGLRITAGLADALQHAHDVGVIHRDIKPGNIIVDNDGRPMLLDFGVAKLAGTWSGLTRPGTTVGTPSYMAPEQASGQSHRIGAHSDVYSLGAVLFEMLTGRAPFEGNNPVKVMQAVVDDDPPDPREIRPEVSADAAAICLRALSKNPADRYRSSAELAEDCTRALNDLPIDARPIAPPARLVKFLRRNRIMVALVVVGLIGAAVSALILLLPD